MKALLSLQPGDASTLQLLDVPDPVESPGQLLVRVRACGVNYPDALHIQDLYQVKQKRPFSPGGELCGVVERVGADVRGFAPGDLVIGRCGIGAMAEKIAIAADRCVKIPADSPVLEAAGLVLTYATAYYALVDRARLQPGETLLVLGAAGGVGCAAIDLGRALGARVVAAASTQAKLDFAMACGAQVEIHDALVAVLCGHLRLRVLVAAVARVALVVGRYLVTRDARRRVVTIEPEVPVVIDGRWLPALGPVAGRAVRLGVGVDAVLRAFAGMTRQALRAQRGRQYRVREAHVRDRTRRTSVLGVTGVALAPDIGERLVHEARARCRWHARAAVGELPADRLETMARDALVAGRPLEWGVTRHAVVPHVFVARTQRTRRDGAVGTGQRGQRGDGQRDEQRDPRAGHGYHLHSTSVATM